MIHIITALKCEANPIISHLDLKYAKNADTFQLYQNETVSLVVSGIGKVSSAAAVAYLYGNNNADKHDAWLNLGIAGHSHYAIGQGILTHKITDSETKQNWYPVLPKKITLKSDCLTTVNQPDSNYSNNTLYDMEAAGFFSIASRCAPIELLQCYKVISDNATNSTLLVKKPMVENIIAQNIGDIKIVINYLDELSTALKKLHAPPKDYEACVEHWHFSHYQKKQLQRLLACLENLSPDIPIWSSQLRKLVSGGDVLSFLEKQINSIAAVGYSRTS